MLFTSSTHMRPWFWFVLLATSLFHTDATAMTLESGSPRDLMSQAWSTQEERQAVIASASTMSHSQQQPERQLNDILEEEPYVTCVGHFKDADLNRDRLIDETEYGIFVHLQSQGRVDPDVSSMALQYTSIFYSDACLTCFALTPEEHCCSDQQVHEPFLNLASPPAYYEATVIFVCTSVNAIVENLPTAAPLSSIPTMAPVTMEPTTMAPVTMTPVTMAPVTTEPSMSPEAPTPTTLPTPSPELPSGTWQVTTTTAPREEDTGLGSSLAFRGNYLVAGEPLVGANFIKPGQVQPLVREGPGQPFRDMPPLVDATEESLERFGSAVDMILDASTGVPSLVVGASRTKGLVSINDRFGAGFYYEYDAMNAVWNAVGGTLRGDEDLGEAGGELGQAVSVAQTNAGVKRIALGSPSSSIFETKTLDVGRVYTYELVDVNGNWTRLTADPIVGPEFSFLGAAVDLSSDGMTLAVGAPGSLPADLTAAGFVSVYTWNDESSRWDAASITGGTGLDTESFGSALQWIDSDKFAVSGPTYNSNAGMVRVFQRNSSGGYSPLGMDITGSKAEDHLGKVLCGGNGRIATGIATGQFGVYQYNSGGGTWDLLGNPFTPVQGGSVIGCAMSEDGASVAVATDTFQIVVYDLAPDSASPSLSLTTMEPTQLTPTMDLSELSLQQEQGEEPEQVSSSSSINPPNDSNNKSQDDDEEENVNMALALLLFGFAAVSAVAVVGIVVAMTARRKLRAAASRRKHMGSSDGSRSEGTSYYSSESWQHMALQAPVATGTHVYLVPDTSHDMMEEIDVGYPSSSARSLSTIHSVSEIESSSWENDDQDEEENDTAVMLPPQYHDVENPLVLLVQEDDPFPKSLENGDDSKETPAPQLNTTMDTTIDDESFVSLSEDVDSEAVTASDDPAPASSLSPIVNNDKSPEELFQHTGSTPQEDGDPALEHKETTTTQTASVCFSETLSDKTRPQNDSVDDENDIIVMC